MIKLMIKEHLNTGLKYLCKTTRIEYVKYPGSGTRWRKHLDKHGYNFKTTLLFQTDDKEEFKKVAISYSNKFNIVNDRSWANYCKEEGSGGATTTGKVWVNNGIKNKYIQNIADIELGWKKGRINCVFNDSLKQKEFAARVDLMARGHTIKNAWIDRDKNGLGSIIPRDIRGEKNPSKNPEVRAKMKESALKRVAAGWAGSWCRKCIIDDIEFKSITEACKHFKLSGYRLNKDKFIKFI